MEVAVEVRIATGWVVKVTPTGPSLDPTLAEPYAAMLLLFDVFDRGAVVTGDVPVMPPDVAARMGYDDPPGTIY